MSGVKLIYDRKREVPKDYAVFEPVNMRQSFSPSFAKEIQISLTVSSYVDLHDSDYCAVMPATNIAVIHEIPACLYDDRERYKCIFPYTFAGQMVRVPPRQYQQPTPAPIAMGARVSLNMPLAISRHLLYGIEIEEQFINASLNSMERRIEEWMLRIFDNLGIG